MNAALLLVACLLGQFEGPAERMDPPAEVQRVPTSKLVGAQRVQVRPVRMEDAAGPRPVPPDFTLTGYRVHVFASEDLEPDALRRLVRPGVTLWLHTRSNMLKGSTVDTLRRAERAWVQLRAPVLPVHWEQLGKLPEVGVWLDTREAEGKVLARRGTHPLAVDVRVPTDASALIRMRAQSLVYRVPVAAQEVAQVPGERLAWAGVTGGSCAEARPGLKLRVDPPWAAECGYNVLAQLTRLDVEALKSLFVRSPGAELAVEVAASEPAALGVSRLLDVLDEASGRRSAP